MRVLLIDDETIYQKQLAKPLADAGYELEFVNTGNKGLHALSANTPDIVITDLKMPDIHGFEIITRIRRDPRHDHITIICITANDSLEDKLKAFDLGADDYLVKPFESQELVARLGILARRGKAMRIVQELETDRELIPATVVAVHSLRGGVGSSTLAVNLALAFTQIWNKPTVALDAVLAAGQVAMMLNASPRATWQDMVGLMPNAVDDDLLVDVTSKHSSGLSFVAAPRLPLAMDAFTEEFWRAILKKYEENHEFLILDLAHDFSDITIPILNMATDILLIITPDMASLRAAVGALSIYDRLGYHPEKIKLVLNHNVNQPGIKQAQLEKVLGRSFEFIIPNEPKEVFRAINFGEPLVMTQPELPISIAIEDMAYALSNEFHKNIPPAAPSVAWKRVTSRVARKS